VTPAASVLAESLRGVATPGRAHRELLAYLLLQAIVVFLWWPKDSLLEVLGSGDAPATLFAAVLAAGFLSAWQGVRAGAEEVLLPGQRGLREWPGGGAGRLLAGRAAGHLVESAWAVGLALPLMLTGFAVSGGQWVALGWCVAAMLAQALCFRLAGTVLFLRIGHRPMMTLVATRALVVLTYAVTALLIPAASHAVLSLRLLRADAPPPGEAAAPGLFLGLCLVVAVVLLAAIHRQLQTPDAAR
jgi:hypothetical protein